MSYQVGQAIVFINIHGKVGAFGYYLEDGRIYRFNKETKSWQKSKWNLRGSRPATEIEVLAEATNHGWTTQDGLAISPKGHFALKKNDYGWYLPTNALMQKPNTVNLKEYCEEGLMADILIKSLKIVK